MKAASPQIVHYAVTSQTPFESVSSSREAAIDRAVWDEIPMAEFSPALEESPVNSTESVDGVTSGPDGPVLSSPQDNIRNNVAIIGRSTLAFIFIPQVSGMQISFNFTA